MDEERESEGLAGRTARGAAWIVAARMAMRLFGFVNMLVLARLLAPADFGLVAVALTAMQLLQNFSDIGVSQAVVRFRDAGRGDLDTLFTLSALRGLAVAALMVVAAPLAASFYGDPRMTALFAVAGLYPLATGFINPRFYEFERNLDFSKEFLSSALNKFAGVAVSIAIAVIFRSYWAIVIGLVVSGVVQLALSYLMRPYRPRFTLVAFRKVFGFAGWLTGVSFVAALNNKLDAFVLARAVGASGTGLYYVGVQLAEMTTNEIAAPMARAVYPGLAALQSEAARMRAGFLKGVEALAAVALPASIGFAFVAEDLIGLLFGEKWAEAVPVVEILTPVIGLQTLFVATQFYAMALGRTRLVFIREVVFFLIRFPLFVWASLAYGLMGAVWASAACGLFHVALNLALYAQVARARFWEPLWRTRRSLAAVAAMAGWFVFLRPLVPAIADAPAAFRLPADIVIGAGVYIAALAAFWRAEGRPDGIEAVALSVVARAVDRRRRA